VRRAQRGRVREGGAADVNLLRRPILILDDRAIVGFDKPA
jgi:hypothetical protein